MINQEQIVEAVTKILQRTYRGITNWNPTLYPRPSLEDPLEMGSGIASALSYELSPIEMNRECYKTVYSTDIVLVIYRKKTFVDPVFAHINPILLDVVLELRDGSNHIAETLYSKEIPTISELYYAVKKQINKYRSAESIIDSILKSDE